MTAAQPRWTGADGSPLSQADAIGQAARANAVLLGERHDRADHHRWQLHVTAGLAAHRNIVVGFEMFPARLDDVLAEWVAGDLSEAAFLERAEWGTVWGFDADLYLPLFHFCRDTGVPMVGLNVRRDLVRAVGAGGWEAVPDADREGLSPARPSPAAYRQFIFDLTGGASPQRKVRSPDDPAFDRFLRAQEVWDRAFATNILAASRRPNAPLVVGIIGMGHLQFGGGVTWQLADLGMKSVITLIPQDRGEPFRPGAADACFTLAPLLP